MATKPTDTVPLWASNANWGTGPSAGSPTKADPAPYAANGHIEGSANPTRADVQNGWQNRVSQWCEWTRLGSSLGAADAHIVETASDGTTSLKGLTVDATGSASVAAVYVTQAATRKGVYVATTGGTVIVGQDDIGVEAGGAMDCFTAAATGDHVPYSMTAQTSTPVTFTASNVPIFAVRGVYGGNNTTTFNTAIESTKEYIATYGQQHVRAIGYDNTHTATNSETTAVAAINWPTRKTLHSSTQILITATFDYDTVSAPMTLTVRVRQGASIIGTTQFRMGNTADTASGSCIVRKYISAEPSASTGGYSLTVQTSAGTVNLYEIILTAETAA